MDKKITVLGLIKSAPLVAVDTVAKFVPENERARFVQKGGQAIQEANVVALIHAILPHFDRILENASIEDVDSIFNVLFSLINEFSEDVLRNTVIPNICATVRANLKDHTVTRMNILLKLANFLRTGSELRIRVFVAVLAYSAETDQFVRIWPITKDAADEIATNPDLQRILYAQIIETLERTKTSVGSHLYTFKYLLTYEDSKSIEELNQAKPVALKAAISVIRDPITAINSSPRLFSLRAIQHLQTDSKFSDLFQLLSIISTDNLASFLHFAQQHKSIFQQYELDYEQCVSYMRLLTLSSLAADTNELPYQTIANELQTDISEVENWVVNAISVGLLDAKLDQSTQTVAIRKTVYRHFGDEQWRQLSDSLHFWKNTVQNLLDQMNRHLPEHK